MSQDDTVFLNDSTLLTPSYVLSEQALISAIKAFDGIRRETGYHVLFALKSSSLKPALDIMKRIMDGFAASSVFETMLARQVMQTRINGTGPLEGPTFTCVRNNEGLYYST
ncbi:MAG: Carboxynorspermidine/carboxyspermidine decarboxylase [Syntrophorhabdaceae bacterium PtaU1.Bin034]|nr:MAG: Carboxynorspermidine/carboxyspermidine decarboxylase [Syntrophorhabdaceae bacterium PtaU1.Bin034]